LSGFDGEIDVFNRDDVVRELAPDVAQLEADPGGSGEASCIGFLQHVFDKIL